MVSRPLLLGHRGLRSRSFSVRENTVAAFDMALQHGCDGFEFDVRLSADNRAVICHGARFAGITIARAACTRLRLLPLLDSILERYASRAFLDIELKVAGIESFVLDAVLKFPPARGYVISSFLPEVLTDLRRRSKSVALGIICETAAQFSTWPDLPVQYIMAQERLITEELLAQVHAAGKRLFAWTINKKASMIRLADWGVDGIVSDRTDLLVKTLKTK
jgi:glycerophosphoryl diester phosphodiesterase